MHRHYLQNKLQQYGEIWSQLAKDQPWANPQLEIESRDRISKFTGENEDCFERHCPTGHITGSALITNLSMNRVLLTHHKKLNKWLQLGGHADGEWEIDQVAMREAEEESGLPQLCFAKGQYLGLPDNPIPFDIDIHEIPARKKAAAHFHYDIRFLIIADDKIPVIISDESNDLKWFDLEEARQLTDEWSMIRQFEKLDFLKSIIGGSNAQLNHDSLSNEANKGGPGAISADSSLNKP